MQARAVKSCSHCELWSGRRGGRARSGMQCFNDGRRRWGGAGSSLWEVRGEAKVESSTMCMKGYWVGFWREEVARSVDKLKARTARQASSQHVAAEAALSGRQGMRRVMSVYWMRSMHVEHRFVATSCRRQSEWGRHAVGPWLRGAARRGVPRENVRACSAPTRARVAVYSFVECQKGEEENPP